MHHFISSAFLSLFPSALAAQPLEAVPVAALAAAPKVRSLQMEVSKSDDPGYRKMGETRDDDMEDTY